MLTIMKRWSCSWIIRIKGQDWLAVKPGPEVIKLFFMNSAEHDIFSANKHENDNNSWGFHIHSQWNFLAQLCSARENLQLLVIWDLLAEQILCSA